MITVLEVYVPVDTHSLSIDFSIQIPNGATILDVAKLAGIIIVWALADTTQPLVTRNLIARGAGTALPNKTIALIGRGQMDSGFGALYFWEIKP